MEGVIEFVRKQGRRVTCRSPRWAFLPPCPDLIRFDEPASLLSAALEEHFATSELIASRIYVNSPDGSPRLSPLLAAHGRPFLVVRENSTPVDLVSRAGAVVSADPPCFDCCRDDFIRKFDPSNRIVLAPCTNDDLTLSRLLQLPTTSDAGLKGLSPDQADRLLETKPLDNQLRVAARRHGFTIVLVGCNLSALSREIPAELTPILRRMRVAEKVFPVSPDRVFRIWCPAASELDGVAAAAEFHRACLARDRIWKSVQRSSLTISEFQYELHRQRPIEFAEAWSQLQQRVQSVLPGTPMVGLREAISAYESASTTTFLEPLLEAISREENPVRRQLFFLAAKTMRHQLETDPQLMHARELVRTQQPVQIPVSEVEALSDLKQFVKLYLSIAQALLPK